MRNLFFLSVFAITACSTSSGGGLDQIVRGPARICLDRSAFTLPVGGTIVEAERGNLGTHLLGRVGPNAFEITESGSFAATTSVDATVVENAGFVVRQIGELPGSYAVYLRNGTRAQQPIVRIEHLFGTDSVTLEQFFATFDPAGAARGQCDRRFAYGG